MDVRNFLDELLRRQEKNHAHGQNHFKGFFYNHSDLKSIFSEWWQASLLPFSLLNVVDYLPDQDKEMSAQALKLYLDFYILRLSRTNVFATIPVTVTLDPYTHDYYRTLAGRIKFRYFLPCLSDSKEPKRFIRYGQGTNPNLLGQAAILFRAGRLFGKEEYKILALRQLEWVHGANPFGICMASCRGTVNLYPHSRYAGIITGGILNAITGDEKDLPHIGGKNYELEWQTLEYWSPQQALYLMCLCELHPEYSLETDIGIRPCGPVGTLSQP